MVRDNDIGTIEHNKGNRIASHFAFVDVEVDVHNHRILDIGAIRYDGAMYHSPSKEGLVTFLNGVDYVCGHNIIHHDIKYLFRTEPIDWQLTDTLYMSPLLFPERPYHKLLKNDKLLSEQMNNPINDCKKSWDLFNDEVSQWRSLSEEKRLIFASLLAKKCEFKGFMEMMGYDICHDNLTSLIVKSYQGRICQNADLSKLIHDYPCELAFALALVDTTDYRSITPGWVLHTYPNIEYVLRLLRHTRCEQGCPYCNTQLNIHHQLKSFFGYDQFRTYEGEALQEKAVQAAVDGKSLLAIFPTGGGKSLTFQLPALIEGRSVHGLTVVISPLLSLMKDQVDNLTERGIMDAVTINGLLDPINRALAIQRVMEGDASLLYIAPEMLRSKTIESILMSRHVVRFVIDEAHCFSSWGQDFRVDYLYIGKFIKDYQQKKGRTQAIPISCFTATAKQKVIQDICDYFRQMLDLELNMFASQATRTNLHYSVIHAETDEDKYIKLRSLIAESECPTIVYVSRTKRTKDLAFKLTHDGFKALPFNGKMEAEEKIANQEAFMNDHVRIIVATSAFGMGVDKKDVGLVIHYDISDSLENYVQEAGRAGRDPSLNARCYVLYNDNDLDKHFILLNQTKLSISEIQQIWKAVKEMTKQQMTMHSSALEIARQAGWDNSVSDIETRVRTALSALEQGGYLERGNNMPHVYATGITVKNVDEARKRISESVLFEKEEVEKAVRIIKSLISQKNISKAQDAESESRIDYLADILGLTKHDVVSAVNRMRQEGILADSKDISAYLMDCETASRPRLLLEKFAKLEQFVLNQIPNNSLKISRKQLNENAVNAGIAGSSEKNLHTLLNFLTLNGYIQKQEDSAHNLQLFRRTDSASTLARFNRRVDICRFVIDWLYANISSEKKRRLVQFSIVELLKQLQLGNNTLFSSFADIQLPDVEEALLYLSQIGVLQLEGGFMVLYNTMEIHRIKDNKSRYRQEDYRMLNEFYKQKIQQVHIVGEYANLMVKDYDAALKFVRDYFQMDYKRFIAQYFKGNRIGEIQRNVTPEKYQQLFGSLSAKQMEIISDKESHCIVVAAGPGSGKTRVLVHKLASLLLLEDVKHEQLLMLTFSRAAATEFKQRLIGLIGNAAQFVEIKTFHSYSFDLLGRIGNIDEVENVVGMAAKMIATGEVEPNKVRKSVLVIDEAQDMDDDEYLLVKALMDCNDDMRVIAVGDDDQNIFSFRGANASHMQLLTYQQSGKLVEMIENYRSSQHVVAAANAFVTKIQHRMKSTPIVSMSKELGWVSITHHQSKELYEPLAQSLLDNHKAETACVLTQTNEEAAIIVALLRDLGIDCQLIQSIDGIRFWNLAEIRYFIKCLDQGIQSSRISNTLWEQSKQATFEKYKHSECLVYVRRCISLFEKIDSTKYYSDFRDFVFESSIEDFYDTSGGSVVVSTIHKAKGMEFDDVYMMISDEYAKNDDLTRRYYVGMTRAKRRLFIHTNSNLFDHIPADEHKTETQQYLLPKKVILQLSHKDVKLGFFENCKQDVLSLRSGDSLNYRNHTLTNPQTGKIVAILSNKMQETLLGWEQKGYHVLSASVVFVVAWKPKDATKEESESAVLLADLKLVR